MLKYIHYVFTFGIYMALTYFKMRYYSKHIDEVPYETRFELVKKWMDCLFNAANVQTTVVGLENIPKKDGFVFCPNHQAFTDPCFILHNDNHRVYAVAKDDIKSFPFIGRLATALETKYLVRDDLRSAFEISKEITNDLKRGKNILLYPEGTRSKHWDYHLNEFKAAAFKSVMAAKATIVPVVLWGYFTILDPRCKNKENPVYIEYLEPITYEDYKDMDNIQLSELIKSKIEVKINAFIKRDMEYLLKRKAYLDKKRK